MKKIWAVLILLAAVFISYAPALGNGFVWDDTALIARDPLIRSWRLAGEAFNHFLFIDATPSDFYRPLQRLTYEIDYQFAGLQPALYHFTSILYHAFAAISLLFLAEELLVSFAVERGRARIISLVAVLVWAIHPIQSAAVVYVSGRADLLAAGFGFLGLFCCTRARYANNSGKFALIATGGLAFLLSAFSKEVGLIFPLLAVVFALIQRNWRLLWKTAGVTTFVVAIYLVLRLGAEHY
ncbi:MAG TPA: hypothetical protein VJ721_03740, partial [Chthoniobacterales bacterium]|nr:hypothetical protein [Chthoniobacterales bacterium]